MTRFYPLQTYVHIIYTIIYTISMSNLEFRLTWYLSNCTNKQIYQLFVSPLKAKSGSFCREYPAVISATSDSQDSTDDRPFRPDGYDISPTNDTNQSDPENGEGGVQTAELQDISEDETSKASSLPGLIIVMPERRKAVASRRT